MDTLVEYDVKFYQPVLNEWIKTGTFATLKEAETHRDRTEKRLQEETSFSFRFAIVKRTEEQIPQSHEKISETAPDRDQ